MNAPRAGGRSWRREPLLWLVIGIPLAAVLGGLLTLYLALRGADPVIAGAAAGAAADPSRAPAAR